MSEIVARVEECKCEFKFYQEHGKQFRAHHLNERLHLAQERDDKEAVKKIAAIIQREKQGSFWCRLNYVTGKKWTRSATSIHVPSESGLVKELSAQEAVENAIFAEVHGSRYALAKEAPICPGKLAEDLLNRTYLPPPDPDAATKELFDEVAAIR